MSAHVLSQVTLGHQLVWNRWRTCSGVRLFVQSKAHVRVDAQRLLQAIAEIWPNSNDRILLSVRSPALLADLLAHAAMYGVGIEIEDHWLADGLLAARIQAAKNSGIRLIWHGTPGQTPCADVQDWFYNTLRALTAQQALHALRASKQRKTQAVDALASRSPIVAKKLYEGLANPMLVTHALDTQGVAGVVGWPNEEVLHSYHFKPIQPSRALLGTLIQAIAMDQPVDSLEQYVCSDPLLAYRLMRYANSASLGLQRTLSDVRDAIVSVGYAQLRAWATEQMPRASKDLNLDPIRLSMVLRAKVMQHLAHAGTNNEALGREAFLCGLFSQLDLLLNEPLSAIVRQLPLPDAVRAAMTENIGPYVAWMEAASALEEGSSALLDAVCDTYALAPQDVNRALLQALANFSNAH